MRQERSPECTSFMASMKMNVTQDELFPLDATIVPVYCLSSPASAKWIGHSLRSELVVEVTCVEGEDGEE